MRYLKTEFFYPKFSNNQDKVLYNFHKLYPEIDNISYIFKNNKPELGYSFVNATQNTDLNTVINLANKKRELEISTLVLIGIGGSSLGALAVYDAFIKNNPNYSGPKFFCADNIDSMGLSNIIYNLELDLIQNKNVLFVIVSKSGSTLETAINSSLLFELLKKYRPANFKDYIVCISMQNSVLHKIAGDNNFDFLDIPDEISGRFSIFTNAAIFIIAFWNVFDLKDFFEGANQAISDSLSKNLDTNNAALSALLLYYSSLDKRNIYDNFFYNSNLSGFGGWYRQLFAESLGKPQTINYITPILSFGTNDLHSMAQLYFSNSVDRFTQFIYVKEEKNFNLKENIFSSLIAGDNALKNLSEIKFNIFTAVLDVYKDTNSPFIAIYLDILTPHNLGYLMQIKMFEIVYLAYLFNINAFDQPQVELYKIKAKQLLII